MYRFIIGSYAGNDAYLDKFVPSSFTTPLTAAAARVHAPLRSDYADNPWFPILGHGLYNPLVSLSSCLAHSGLWGGVTVDTYSKLSNHSSVSSVSHATMGSMGH